jgi:hypothetical protein
VFSLTFCDPIDRRVYWLGAGLLLAWNDRWNATTGACNKCHLALGEPDSPVDGSERREPDTEERRVHVGVGGLTDTSLEDKDRELVFLGQSARHDVASGTA